MKLWKKAVALLLCATMTLAPSMSSLAFTAPTSDNPVVVDSLKDGYSDDANAYEIYPVPHYVDYTAGTNGEGKFTMTKEVNVVRESGVDEYTVKFLEEILTKYDMTATYTDKLDPNKTNILLGVKGSGETVDKSVENVTLNVEGLFDPKRNDPNDMSADRLDSYLLTVDTDSNKNGVVTIIGHNTDSTYYGVATLQMMFSSFAARYFYPIHIEDYSNTIYRGFIEGFYGVYEDPYWARESQMRSIRDVKGNIYVFAAKGDVYHGEKWNVLYPEEELNDIKHLVEVSKETKVQYAWSVHLGLGKFFSGVYGADPANPKYQEKLTQLLAKFEQLYEVGVRNFHVLNDDYNSGNYAQAVMLLNDLNKWRKEKGCGPIIYCMNGYGQDFSKIAELNALQAVDPDVFMYWTGGSVNTPITQSNINYPLEHSKHYPVTWLNFPCSEHCGPTNGKYLPFLGDISYYVKGTDGLQNQKGIICNPVKDHTESTKVGYFQMLSWGWNRDNYSTYSNEIWEDCFKYLQPEVYESYLTIARNISNAADSGRIPQNDNGFPESEYIKQDLLDVKAKVLAGEPLKGDAQVESLLKEFDNILAALDDFNKNCTNKELLKQIDLWLITLEDVVNAAKESLRAVMALQNGDLSTTWSSMSIATNAMQHWYATAPGKQPTTGRGAGSKRIQPFAKAVLAYADEKFNSLIESSADGRDFYAVLGGVDQATNTQAGKVFDGDKESAGNFQINQKANDYFGMDLGSVKLVSAVDVLQGATDTDQNYFHNAVLEASVDGENWDTLVTRVNSHHISVDNMRLPARYVRLRLLSTGYGETANFWTTVREFTVSTIENTSTDIFYTNVPELTGSVTEDGGTYTMAALSGVTLENGQYVGIRLPEITGINKIETAELPAGLTLQYSANSVVWTDGAMEKAVPVRYVRVVNNSGAAVTADIPAVSASMSYVAINPKEVKNQGMPIYQNNYWSKAVDGDRNTMAWVAKKQNIGDYVVFDLGGNVELHDLTVVTTGNGADYPHGLDISISETLDGEYTVVGTNNDDWKMDPTDPIHKIFTCDAKGKTARYLKLELNQEASSWSQFNEIEINKDFDATGSLGAFSGTPVGDFEKAMDGSLATSLSFKEVIADENSYMQYLLSGNTTPESIMIFQGNPACNAELQAQVKDGSWKTLGKLDQAVKTFETADLGNILALRLNWEKGSSPSIAEIILQGGSDNSNVQGEVPALINNIVEPVKKGAGDVAVFDDFVVEYGTALEELPLPATVSVVNSDGTTVELNVNWTNEGYSGNKSGSYIFTGTFEMDESTLVNPGHFTLVANVVVKMSEDGSEQISGNLALEKKVEGSGHEAASDGGQATPDKAVDGKDTRWVAGPKIKETGVVDEANQFPGVEWIIVDLNTDKDGVDLGGVNSITDITLKCHTDKSWPTKYDIYVSDEPFTVSEGKVSGGTKVGNFECEPENRAGHEDQVTAFEEAVSGRYVCVVFNAINKYASGATGVSVKELEVHGTKTYGSEGPVETTHSVTVDSEIANGTVTVNKTTAMNGETVTVTVTAPEGYRLAAGSLKVNGVVVNGNTFQMPSEDAVVTAQFERIQYSVSLPEGKGYTVNGPDKVNHGESGEYTLTLEEGYFANGLVVKANGTSVTVTGGKFTISNITSDVVVTVEGAENDTNAPLIQGVEDGKAYCENQTITVTDENLNTVTVDGNVVTLTDGKYTLTAGKHVVVATDKAGNSTTVTVTIGHVWGQPAWTWADKTTATFNCVTDPSHKEVVVATVTSEITKEATCTREGELTYTATVTFAGETYKDVDTEVIPKTPHHLVDGICTECGEDFNNATDDNGNAEHKHTGNGAWVSDDNEHWHVCDCGEIIDKAAHTAGKDGECSACHKVLGAPVDSNNGNQNTGSPNTGDTMNVLPWIVLIGAALAAAVVVLKRKKVN